MRGYAPGSEEFGGQPDPQWPRSAAGPSPRESPFIACLSPAPQAGIERPKIDKDTPLSQPVEFPTGDGGQAGEPGELLRIPAGRAVFAAIDDEPIHL